MTDVADEVTQDLASMITADDQQPVVVNPDEEAVGVPECEYCGHCPCACGG